jgi:nitrogen fixation NifU-like protein
VSSTDALYQELILEHNRKPRNFREMEDATISVEGRNRLCGDALTLWMRLSGDEIADVSF